DDSMSTEEVVLGRKEMHRTAAAFAAAGFFSEQLRHRRAGAAVSCKILCVDPIGGDDVILRLQRADHAGSNRFLSDVEVEETTDLPLGVEPRGLLLEAPHEKHLAVKLKNRISVH